MSRTDELRQAAKTLRQRANAASPAPWRTFDHHGRDMTDEGWSEIGVQNDGHTVAITYPTGFENDHPEPDAAYIATMDPTMGLLLAETLETEAKLLDMLEPFTELLNATVEAQGGPKGALRLLVDDDGLPKVVSDSTPSWLRIARLINGTEEP